MAFEKIEVSCPQCKITFGAFKYPPEYPGPREPECPNCGPDFQSPDGEPQDCVDLDGAEEQQWY